MSLESFKDFMNKGWSYDATKAPLDSPTFTGTPKAPTAAAGTNTTQIATCEFVENAVESSGGGGGSEVNITKDSIEAALGYSPVSESSINELSQKIAAKQNILSAGDNITIEDNVISASTFSGDYSDLTGKPDIPIVKTDPYDYVYRINNKDISALCDYDGNVITKTYATKTALSSKQDAISDLTTIRSGAAKGATALQSYTETDPTVPDWAKAETKPSYTAAEVGALPSDTELFSGDYNDLSNKPTIPAAVTDAHINALIDAKLGVIENGSY